MIAITGDVFDSASLPADLAIDAFLELHRRLLDAVGGSAPTVLVPGNHDRRRKGLVGPHRGDLFAALARAAPSGVFVHGTRAPFLAEVVPKSFHGLDASLVAYDSTYLPTGLISAGGVVRQEDLLHAAARLEPGDAPVILLIHHHLVPTPLTDLGVIEPPPERWLRYGLQRVLPGLVANADREELTMTALGAGTALSTLHTLRRAVLVLHGHKHYATARHLRRTVRDHGDVIVASAGSAGSAERWSPAGTTDFARLWPSLNAVSLEGRDLSIETVSFGYKGAKVGRVVTTPLLRATRDEARWETTPIKTEGRGPSGPELELNESRCTLVRTLGHRGGRWDVLYERRLRRSGDSPHRYLEHVEGAPGSMLEIGAADDLPVPSPGPVELTLEGEGVTRYRLVAGVCRTIEEAELVYGSRTAPYEWIGLMNRYACQRATLSITGLGNRSSDCFASITDLGTGLEEPLRANPSEAGDSVAVTVAPCAPRALLRIYWPLEARGR
jgi:hypothetical protein